MRIGWIVSDTSERVASTRYRCHYPAIALESHGYESRFYHRSADAIGELDQLDVVVLVKRVDGRGAELAQLARSKGKRVVIDMCDNILVWSYEKTPDQRSAQHLIAASLFADVMVFASSALADAVRPYLPASAHLVVIPDQVETRESVAAAERLTARQLRVQPSGQRRGTPLGRIVAFAKFAVVSPGEARRVVRRKLSLPGASGMAGTKRSRTPLARLAAFARFAVVSPAEARQVLRRKLSLPGASGSAVTNSSVIKEGPLKVANPNAAIAKVVPEMRDPQTRSVVWFGNYGAPHSDFGMLALLKAVPALEAVSRDVDLELVIVSNSEKTYASYVAPLPIRSRYIPWSSTAVFDALAQADVCLLPFGDDDFSVTKSANRAALALAHGVPVVASPLESHEPLRDCIVVGEWERGLRRYLGADRFAAREADVAKARPLLDLLYSSEATARAWLEILDEAQRPLRFGRAIQARGSDVAVLLGLGQDLDVLLPVIDALRRRRDVRLKVLLAEGLVDRSPRVLKAMIERGIVPYALERALILEGDDRAVRGLDALITGAETSLNPHRVPHALTLAAQSVGVETYTLQHGIENVGLSYFDDVHDAQVEIAADHILTWADPVRLPSAVPPGTRARCRVVGRTSKIEAQVVTLPDELAGRQIVGVFENLHWHRYSEAYRKAFIYDVAALARERPDLTVLVKPHHAGQFLVKNPGFAEAAPSNLVIANPTDPRWEPYTAPALIPLCVAVVTTPSTVALDAAELDVPVAVAAYDLKLPAFEGLPQLRCAEDWLGFLAGAIADPVGARATATAYRDRVRLPGDAAERVVEFVLSRTEGRRQRTRIPAYGAGVGQVCVALSATPRESAAPGLGLTSDVESAVRTAH